MLAGLARFLVGDTWRVPAFRWLAAAFAGTLVADLVFMLTELGYLGVEDRYTNTLFLSGSVLLATGALSPSMRFLTERVYRPERLPGLIRLVLIALAALLPFSVLIMQVARDEPTHLPALLGCALVLFGAALLRWGSLLTDQRRAARRASTLRAYAARLLEASGEEELMEAAEQTARELLPGGSARVALVGGPSRARVDSSARWW